MNLDALNNRVKSLMLKERVGILFAISVVIYGIWDFTFMQPMLEKEAMLNSSLDEKGQLIMNLSEQVQNMIDSDKSPQFKKNRQRLDSVINQLELTDQRLLEITSSLIAPNQMAKVLETLLVQSDGLTIRRLQGLGAKPFPEKVENPDQEFVKNSVATEVNNKEVEVEMPTAWQHGLRVEFSGSYLDTMKYLQSLEELNWKFYWDSVELEVDEYPNVNTAIKVYTLSLDEGWIDV
jgi:MSHA biogenesis protein MshJ